MSRPATGGSEPGETDPSAPARLFVAVVPPPSVLARLDAEFERPVRRGVRYTSPEQWHVTLRFLGQAVVDEAVSALGGLRAGPADVRLGPVTIRLGRRVLCLPAAGLTPLAEAVAAVTASVGRPPERRPFRGHLTLARLDDRAAGVPVGLPFDASFAADEVHLVRSRTRPAGAVYDIVATRHLATGPPATPPPAPPPQATPPPATPPPAGGTGQRHG